MSDLRQASREFMIEFIELYKSHPCLWQIKSKDYSDRNKKDLAYAELTMKYKEVDPNADRTKVVKKINSFRTVYKKELNKINNSIKSGAGTDDVYKPSLWYFELLHFLNDIEPARNSRNTMDESEEENVDQPSAVEDELNLTGDNSEQPDTTPRNIPQTSSLTVSRPNKRKLNLFEQLSLETMQKVGKKIDTFKEDDCLDRFGKHVADRLRDAKPQQQKIAQKLISDVLFEADMESSTRFWKVTGPDVQLYQNNGFQFINYRRDNNNRSQYQTSNHQNFNLLPRPHTHFTTDPVFSPAQSSYTSENSVKDYVSSFNPNQN